TLTENWRSEARLIKAINTIFSSVNEPFIFDEIPFEKARPAKSDITDEQSTFAPLILWYAGSDNNKPINRNDAVLMIAKAVTGEIVRLLSSGYGCEHDCFREGDIAVLVRTNEQARILCGFYHPVMAVNTIVLEKAILPCLYEQMNRHG
ncbi:MAG: hypothetical protein JRJ25_11515, partial [Deltaproteobacteria bacterium]|nr:hypothetical protein [Deltaproteobacteria bacterium]